MSITRRFFLISLGSLALLMMSACQADHAETIVYLVRHAEKDMSDPSAKNPPLTQVGLKRAQHLAERLDAVSVDAIYSTKFERNMNTVKPIAERKGLPVQTYEWHDYGAIKDLLEKERGKTVLLCGHGDNLLPIIKNAGAKSPLDSIGSEDYQYLFKLVIPTNGTADASVETFR